MSITFAASSFTPILSNASAETGMVSIIIIITFIFLRKKHYSLCEPDIISDVLEGFRVYTDDVNKFKISIPQGETEFGLTKLIIFPFLPPKMN